MKCFPFSNWNKKDGPKTPKSFSTLTENGVGRTGSELNSQNVSSTSTESFGRPLYPSTAQRPSDLRVFTVAELKSATKNFSRSCMVGEGGFGSVYKGFIKDLEDQSQKIEVAVKQLGKRGMQGHKEWVTEVNLLGIVEHSNLVKLVGYCAEDDERGIQRLLVYEYMPNGSVDQHLGSRSETTLSWTMRLKIAQDAARGLAYLHEEMEFQIIMRDFKASNILLDENWNAKLSDFGMARLGPTEGLTHVSTAVVGTMGYAAPEYVQTGRLAARSDVWSYGVFLYELITGRRPLDRNRPKSEQKLLEWVKPYLSDSKKFHQILDPRLEGKYPIRSVHKLATIANRCLSRNPKSRPKMSEVLVKINQIVEGSSETGSPRVPLRKTSMQTSRDGQTRNKKRTKNSFLFSRLCSLPDLLHGDCIYWSYFSVGIVDCLCNLMVLIEVRGSCAGYIRAAAKILLEILTGVIRLQLIAVQFVKYCSMEMAVEEQESGVVQWGRRIFEFEPYEYHGDMTQDYDIDIYQGQYVRDHNDTECNHIENDEIIARTLQEEFSQLAIAESSQYSHSEEHLQGSNHDPDWNSLSRRNYSSELEFGEDEVEDTEPSCSYNSPGEGEYDSHSLDLTDEYVLDGEVGKKLNEMIPIPHVPRINGEIPSIDEATSDHERLLNRLQSHGFLELKVPGDGNCQFRALSDQLYGTPDYHKVVRRKVVNQLKSHREKYEGYVPMEYGDYLKNMSKSGEWGDHVTLQAAADLSGVKIVVITSFKDTGYIEIVPNVEKSKGVICLSFWAEVHYNSIYSQGGMPARESRRKKRWWNFGN
ncbi:hypothetical protein QYF36_013981 [Acer negundo]|nr:hypothetical protein QYF36_013981 [Acer negundo]